MCMDSAYCMFCANHTEAFFLLLPFCYARIYCRRGAYLRRLSDKTSWGRPLRHRLKQHILPITIKYIVSSTDTQGLCLIQPLNQQQSCVSSEAEQESHNTLFIMLRATRLPSWLDPLQSGMITEYNLIKIGNLFGNSHYNNDKIMGVFARTVITNKPNKGFVYSSKTRFS